MIDTGNNMDTWLLLSIIVTATNAKDCDPIGWFGLDCQYKCRCAGPDNCIRTDGSCLGGAKCMGGWFGPACQYVNLAYNTHSENEITDDNDDTCANNRSNRIRVSLSERSTVTWLRIIVSDKGKNDLNNVSVSLLRTWSRSLYINCEGKRLIVDDRTLDIFCEMNVKILSLILTGDAVRYLCSVYVSGGRNVALKQKTSQSTYFYLAEGNVLVSPMNAVDGKTSGKFTDLSCTHTAPNSRTPASWILNLSAPKSIQRIRIYNRNEDGLGRRLQNFQLQAFDIHGGLLFNYTDPRADILEVYNILVDHTDLPYSIFIIHASSKENVLTLCEVELFGDSMCSFGNYGRDCEKDCHCLDQGETCFVSTGACPSGCAAGYLGYDCQQDCPPGKYGKDCISSCSEGCAPGEFNQTTCDHINGTCLFLCLPGYLGDRCDAYCPPQKYGKDCNSSCSEGCAPGEFNQTTCDHINGTCLYLCLPGYLGDRCDADCPPQKYGKDCNSNCSEGCAPGKFNQTTCDHINGTCLYLCLPGYLGDRCDAAFTSLDSETNIVTPAVIVPVTAVLVACMLISFVFIRKQRRNREATNNTTYKNEPSVNKFQLESLNTPKPASATNKMGKEKTDDTQQGAADTKAADSVEEPYSIPDDIGNTSENVYSSIDGILT